MEISALIEQWRRTGSASHSRFSHARGYDSDCEDRKMKSATHASVREVTDWNVPQRNLTRWISGLFIAVLFSLCPLGAARDAGQGQHNEVSKGEPSQQGARGKVQSWYDKWLNEEVQFIITDSERSQFKTLTTDEERKHFIEKFWEIRNPNPGTTGNTFKKEYYRRLAYAKDHYSYLAIGREDDRARIYIQFGPPSRVEFLNNGACKRPAPVPGAGSRGAHIVERWGYGFIQGIGKNVQVEFADPSCTNAHRVVIDPVTLIDRTPTVGAPN